MREGIVMGGNGDRRLRFGDYELDSRSGKLLRDGLPVKIQPQPLRVLAFLTEHRGEIISREQLRERIWGEATFVEFDQGLNYCIRQIRMALRDDASKPAYIETLPKQGYRFIAPIVANGQISDPVFHPAASQADPTLLASPMGPVPPTPPPPPHWKVLGTAAIVVALAAAGIALGVVWRPAANQPITYTQITSFTDAAVGPALSPDGRMVAFFRSDRAFFTADQIYVKMLPDGEPVQLTHDPRLKYNLAFSPDSSRIAYTVVATPGTQNGWDTYTVSSLGAESKLFLSNASGLSWLDQDRLLFSEINTGVHMGIVTSREDRSEHREIYFPAEARRMAHYSYPSPDRKWILVAEMNPQWQPCRLIPFSGASPGVQVGPSGACTSAAWSPDGKWMYFGIAMGGKQHHLWRQRFPDGQPEQITSGPTEEDGLAVAPDGLSLITSISTKQNALWIHDSSGDRALSTEGYADGRPPWFSSDGKRLYYLLRRDSPESPNELWRADLNSGSSEAVLPGVSMREYDISDDDTEVVFTTQPAGQASQLWIAPLNRSAPPRMIGASGGVQPHFGPAGQILFRLANGNAFYLAKIGRDGSGMAKILPSPILDIHGISRDRRFVIIGVPFAGSKIPGAHAIAVPIDGGPARNLCDDDCQPKWSPDGKYFYLGVAVPSQATPAGKTLAIPVPSGQVFPPWPAAGVHPGAAGLAIPGTRVVNQANVAPGLGSTYAYVKPTVHANLFRIPLRQ
jgi:DNA-binding winged helix-turn-helix (wHTH) protein/Tol biopolymer transport system component